MEAEVQTKVEEVQVWRVQLWDQTTDTLAAGSTRTTSFATRDALVTQYGSLRGFAHVSARHVS